MNSLPTVVLGEKSSDPFPGLENLWNIFSRKGVRTVFLSIGNSKSALADLELGESLGCPVNIVAPTEEMQAQWTEVQECVKTHKRGEEMTMPFSEGSEEKWILSRNFRVNSKIPWWHDGVIDVSGVEYATRNVKNFVSDMCINMKIGEADARIDILKIDLPNGLERSVLYSILDAGFRPAVVLVRWNLTPDNDMQSCLTAGHLQNIGYTLVKMIDNKFLYYYTDRDLYNTCSWENTLVINPLIHEIVESIKNSIPRSEDRNHNARFGSASVSSFGETASPSTLTETE